MTDAKTREALRADDAAARRRAQQEYQSPIVLEAGAGTGKTATLVARVVVWSVGEGWDRATQRIEERSEGSLPVESDPDSERARVASEVMSRIVAITFTEAAAAEMAERVGEALLQLSEGGDLPIGVEGEELPAEAVYTERAASLLASIDSLVVRTIHAWCRRVLAQYPLEARLHPNFEVDADKRAQTEIVREVVEETLRDAYAGSAGEVGAADGARQLLALGVEGYGPSAIEEALVSLLAEGIPSSLFEGDPIEAGRVADHLAALGRALASWSAAVGESLEGGASSRSPRTLKLVDAVDGTASWLGPESKASAESRLEDLDALREIWADGPKVTLKAWQVGTFNTTEFKCLGDRSDDVRDASETLCELIGPLLDLVPQRLRDGAGALRPLLAEVHERLRTRGIATFESLLDQTRSLFERKPHVAARVRRSIDQLLVDEFQDTNEVQCDLVRAIALSGELEDRPGLFLVGDPKQSIYGFRAADLRAYESFIEEVRAAGGVSYRLSVNFRSLPAILDEVEAVMSGGMRAEPGVQPDFQPLVAHKSESAGGPAEIEYWDSSDWDDDVCERAKKTSVSNALTREARALACELKERRAEGVEWHEMALLLRAMSDVEEYLSALRDANVPYVVEKDRSYYRRREIIDATALLRCVLDPTDHLALLSVLRSPWVGVPDAALIPLWGRELPRLVTELHGAADPVLEELAAIARDVDESIDESIPGIDRIAGWSLNLIDALRTLAALRESFDCDSVDQFVEGMRRSTLIEAGEAARYLGEYRAANLQRFFGEVLQSLQDGGDHRALLRRLRSDVAKGREATEARPKSASEGAVRIMTIHGAKGLDFRCVYLGQLHKAVPMNRRRELDVRRGQRDYRVFGTGTLGVDALARSRAQTERAELVRTLYVAMTRAKERLVLMGSYAWKEKPPESVATHADVVGLRATLPADLGVTMARVAEELANGSDGAWTDEASARWRFLALEEPPEAEGLGEAGLANAELSIDHAVASGARLRELAREANLRMARPWSGAVTQIARIPRAEAWEQESDREQGMGSQRVTDREYGVAPEQGADTESASSVEQRAGVRSDRSVAATAGTVVHRVLEEVDLASDLRTRVAELRDDSTSLVEALPEAAARSAVAARVVESLDRLLEGSLLERLSAISGGVIARELPLLLPPPEVGFESLDAMPVAAAVGAIDLVYRDLENDEWVVADYKTDRVESAEEIGERSSAYRQQGALYCDALREALGLATAPRFELWFLWADHVEVVSTLSSP